jgi:hypothetical protein
VRGLAHPRFQSVFLHQSDHPFPDHTFLMMIVAQVAVNARAAIPPLAGCERRADQYSQLWM